MKNYKIYTEGNYFYIIDTITAKVYEAHKKNVLVVKDTEVKGIFRFKNVEGFKDTESVKLQNIQKESGVTYTASEFETFYKENTGNFSTASGGSGAVDSVFGRTGAVTAQTGDYTTDQVTESTNKKYVTESEKTAITNIQDKVDSVLTGEPTGSDKVVNIVSLTQAEYDNGTPNPATFYIITDA